MLIELYRNFTLFSYITISLFSILRLKHIHNNIEFAKAFKAALNITLCEYIKTLRRRSKILQWF